MHTPVAKCYGDLTADGIVNPSDMAALALAYVKEPGHPDFNPCCDYTHDGLVKLSDPAYY